MSLNICQYFRPISISLSPNVEKDDVLLALKLIFKSWKWKRGDAIERLENQFKEYFGVKHAISFNSGRSSFLAILNSLGLEKGDEVLLQAFTCNAVSNPIIYNNLKPVYVDVDEKTFNIDIEDLKKKISPQSRVLMVQHTFGLPDKIDEILEICRENNLILIEDCAHSLGADYKNRKIGTFGRAAFFSFSRDKVISSVYGGMVTTNDEVLARKIKEFQEKINYPSYFWILQQLIHPILINYLILPFYRFFGKYLLVLLQELHILSKAVHSKEKRGMMPSYFPKRMSNSLAILALNQFRKLDKFNIHRKEIAEFYYQELKDTSFDLPIKYDGQIFLRFTIKHSKAHQIIKQGRRKNILIGDWYDKVIAPYDTKLEKIGYTLGSSPKAEKLSKITLNLPTHINISKKEATKVVNFLKREF